MARVVNVLAVVGLCSLLHLAYACSRGGGIQSLAVVEADSPELLSRVSVLEAELSSLRVGVLDSDAKLTKACIDIEHALEITGMFSRFETTDPMGNPINVVLLERAWLSLPSGKVVGCGVYSDSDTCSTAGKWAGQ